MIRGFENCIAIGRIAANMLLVGYYLLPATAEIALSTDYCRKKYIY